MQLKDYCHRFSAFILASPAVFLLTSSATWATPIKEQSALFREPGDSLFIVHSSESFIAKNKENEQDARASPIRAFPLGRPAPKGERNLALPSTINHTADGFSYQPTEDKDSTHPSADPESAETIASEPSDSLAEDPLEQVTSVSQLSDVQPTDWAFQALQSFVERYGCIVGYPNGTYRGNRTLTRYEFAAGLNSCLSRINGEFIATGTTSFVTKEDLATLQKLQEEFATELAILRGRVDGLEARTATLEATQFSTTTKLNAEIIVAATDTFGDRVGDRGVRTNTILAHRGRLNLETSFTGRDLLRTRLEFGNFGNIAEETGTNMTGLNFEGNFGNDVVVPHLLYSTPLASNLSVTIGSTGIGFTDITDTLTPPTIASDSLGIPSRFGDYSPLYRRGGGGGAINWKISKDLLLTLGYLAGDANIPEAKNGLFNGINHSLAQLAYYGDWGAIGLAYSHSYGPKGRVDLTGSTGSFLATRPFGEDIATSSDSIGIQGFYRFSQRFQVHAWGVYTHANAESSGISNLADGRGGSVLANVDDGDHANILYGALGVSFPDIGGEGNLAGILVGLPPRVINSDVRDERDTSYHLEAFYRFQLNDNISITPGFWVVTNPENDSRNDTQWVGLVRTSFNF